MRIAPFRALRASPALAARVAAPPYDVVTREEAVRVVAGNPWSFLRVARSEIDLPPDTDPHAPGVYVRARANLDRLEADGALIREQRPSLYLYRVAAGERAQVGLATCVHVDDYERGVIRTHETTRPDKEDDRTRHALALGAHAEPVLLLYRDSAEIDRLASRELERAPLLERRRCRRCPAHGVGSGRARALGGGLRRGAARLRGRWSPSLGRRLASGAAARERAGAG